MSHNSKYYSKRLSTIKDTSSLSKLERFGFVKKVIVVRSSVSPSPLPSGSGCRDVSGPSPSPAPTSVSVSETVSPSKSLPCPLMLSSYIFSQSSLSFYVDKVYVFNHLGVFNFPNFIFSAYIFPIPKAQAPNRRVNI